MRSIFLLLAATSAAAAEPGSITRVGDVYYRVEPGAISQSTDRSTWAPVRTLATPSWAKGPIRSPRLYVDGQAWLYYTAERNAGGACVGVATAPSVDADFTDHGTLVCTQKGVHFGSEDPFVLAERGVRYLVWKENGDEAKKHAWLLFQELGKDGLSLKDVAHEIVDNDRAWEGEALVWPSLVRRDARLYLFYAGKDGGIGVAQAPSINGPWVKAKTNPLVKKGTSPTIFTTPKNDIKLTYESEAGPTTMDVHIDELGDVTLRKPPFGPRSQPPATKDKNTHP